MKTKIIELNEIEKAVKLLKNSEIVAIPTETVYGLGANALNSVAIAKIFKAKGRPQDNPLIVHICNEKMLDELVLDIPKKAEKLMQNFWPGALTIVFKKSEKAPCEVSKGLETIAIRFPKHETMLEIIEKCKFPIAAPSANTSGRPSTTSFEHVFEDLNGIISAIVKGEASQIGLESTVIDVTREIPVLLRPGGITKEQIEAVIGEVLVDKSITASISDTKKVSSPGMKYRHYAPKATVEIVEGNVFKTAKYIQKYSDKTTGILVFDDFHELFDKKNTKTFGEKKDIETQANLLFAKLREFDEINVGKILAQCPQNQGLGLAVANRLKKASGFNVTKISGKVYGLTGQSGSGKSTATRIFKEKGFEVIDCDEIYSNLLENSTEMSEKLQNKFPKCFENGKINRKLLANEVFADKSKLLILNEITHEFIVKEIENLILQAKNDVILDAPLLFEAKLDKYCDEIIGIVCNEDVRISRLAKRDKLSEKEIKNRLKNQKNDSFYIEHCGIIIENNGNLLDFLQFIDDKEI